MALRQTTSAQASRAGVGASGRIVHDSRCACRRAVLRSLLEAPDPEILSISPCVSLQLFADLCLNPFQVVLDGSHSRILGWG